MFFLTKYLHSTRYSCQASTPWTSYRVQTCKIENIPANSTDNTQPLDVAYCGPLKGAWRKQLTAYSDQDPSAKAMDKTKFPGMPKEVMESVDAKRLLQSGFKMCGIYPLNRQEVLD
jgi:hypothetical protein